MAEQGNLHGAGPELVDWMHDARRWTLDLVADFTDEQMMGPQMDEVNPPVWEIGHVGWFYELFINRGLDGEAPLIPNADDLYTSSDVPHADRWSLVYPSREDTLGYMQRVLEKSERRLDDRHPTHPEAYMYRYSIYHEDMHGEALTYTRQTLGYSRPTLRRAPQEPPPAPAQPGFQYGDVEVPGGTFLLGAKLWTAPLVFDNEKWAHPVELAPFRISRTPVTNAQFREFVEDGGYDRRELWSVQGWRWRRSRSPGHPVYWRKGRDGEWYFRDFDAWVPLEDHHPVVHVSWYEASAYCEWAGRRLPAEAEWEAAASGEPFSGDGEIDQKTGFNERNRRYPWGDDGPSPDRANLDSLAMGCVDVRALPEGDSAFGCRQMLGNVWEWTASTFMPYPGFVPDLPYKDYSAPWFTTTKVLRGGAWATPARMIRNTWRNFFGPHRNDVFAGFRTCAR